MNKTWTVICSAIKASLLAQPISIQFEVNWNDVFNESQKQAIVGIVRNGVKEQLPEKNASAWKLYTLQEISHCIQLLEAQKELVKLLEDNNISYCILKGAAAAIYYPEPYFRTMGDVDFQVPSSIFQTALEVLKSNGYVEGGDSDWRHLKLYKDNILFELHKCFSNDDGDKIIDEYIENAKIIKGKIREAEFCMLPTFENGLVLLVHLRHHLFEGLGFRQVLDWMMYVNKELDDKAWENFRIAARRLNIEKLAIITTKMCQKYFGLRDDIRWCASADEQACDLLFDFLIQYGNFGQSIGRGLAVENTIISFHKEGLFHYLQRAGEFNWRVAISSHPFLRPFAWFYQICRYIKQAKSSGRIGGTLKDDIKRSNERYELLKVLELM